MGIEGFSLKWLRVDEYSQRRLVIEEFLQTSAGMAEYSRNSEDNGRIIQLAEDYNEVFGRGVLNPMDTEPVVVKLKGNYVPKSITVPKKVSYARRNEYIRILAKEGVRWNYWASRR